MTYESKLDWWIAAALILGIVAPLVGGDLWITIPLFLAVGICGYPQFYRTTERGLVIHAGLIRRFIPYEAITFAGVTEEGAYSLGFSLERVRIRCGKGAGVVIAPADCEAFLADMARRAPQLTRRGQDLVLAYV